MQQNIEFEWCIDFLVRMIDKYGDEVLRELEEEKQNKEEKEAQKKFIIFAFKKLHNATCGIFETGYGRL